MAVLKSPRALLPLRSIITMHLLPMLLHSKWLKDSQQAVTVDVVRV
ncbi:hypothetical protein VSR68_04210 [Paraburkholderia phymatum]